MTCLSSHSCKYIARVHTIFLEVFKTPAFDFDKNTICAALLTAVYIVLSPFYMKLFSYLTVNASYCEFLQVKFVLLIRSHFTVHFPF